MGLPFTNRTFYQCKRPTCLVCAPIVSSSLMKGDALLGYSMAPIDSGSQHTKLG